MKDRGKWTRGSIRRDRDREEKRFAENARAAALKAHWTIVRYEELVKSGLEPFEAEVRAKIEAMRFYPGAVR